MPVKVAVCQVPDIREDMEASLSWIEKLAGKAEADAVSLVCFPECFLQGYLTDKSIATKYAINLDSPVFETMLQQLTKYRPMIVFGMIEEEDKNLYNTAVVIRNSKLVGKYRKTHLLDGEALFKDGAEYPVFQISRLRFGISICYDAQLSEAPP